MGDQAVQAAGSRRTRSHRVLRVLALTAAGMPLIACGAEGESAGPDDGGGVTLRAFEDATGTVEIPEDPRRVVALDAQSLEAALAVDAAVVGSVTRNDDQPFSAALEGRTDGIEPLNTAGGELDLERIAAVRPDLVVTQAFALEGIEDEVRAIAPVAVVDYWTDDSYTTVQWEEHFRGIADAVGRVSRVDEALADLDEAVADFAERYPGDPGQVEVSVVRVNPDEWFAQSPVSFQGLMIERLGLSRPAGQTSTESDRVYYSLERLDAADGDVILLSAETVDAEEAAALQESPLWRQLSAVRAGEVHTVDGELWLTGGGVLAGQAIVDDLTEVLMP